MLEFEILFFVYGLAAIVLWKLLSAKINMRGLLKDKSQPSRISPERVQLLISTIVISIGYIRNSASMHDATFRQVDSGLLFLFGGSSLIYSARKVFERFHGAR
jgi:hypothetical protein